MENYNSKGTMTEYSVNIDNQVYQKIMHWVDKAVGEVSGLGKLTLDPKTGLIEIRSAILLKQENTGTSTDLDPASVAKAMFELRNEPGHLNFWWHSHVNMGVFWSGTDMDTIREIGDQGFVVATVFNKKREMLSSIYRKGDDFFPETFINELPTRIIDYIPNEKIVEWDKEFDEKCTAKTYSGYTNNWDQDDYGPNWYKQFQNKRTDQSDLYDLNDMPTDVIGTDDIKVYAILPELVVLREEMEKQTDVNKARSLLFKIMGKINKLKLSSHATSYETKKPYLDAFNTKFPGAFTPQKKIPQAV